MIFTRRCEGNLLLWIGGNHVFSTSTFMSYVTFLSHIVFDLKCDTVPSTVSGMPLISQTLLCLHEIPIPSILPQSWTSHSRHFQLLAHIILTGNKFTLYIVKTPLLLSCQYCKILLLLGWEKIQMGIWFLRTLYTFRSTNYEMFKVSANFSSKYGILKHKFLHFVQNRLIFYMCSSF